MERKVVLDYESESINYLCRKDKRLAKVISMIGPLEYTIHDDSYSFLIHEIIEQMLSVKAGRKIYNRLVDLCGGSITPEKINSLSDTEIKSIGTANSKVGFIRNVTNAVLSGELRFDELADLPDADVFKRLIKVKGIGKWTANMYLIFVLNRQDILPTNDVAFLQGYKWLYRTDDVSDKAVRKKCQKWRPYSSIAARYLYRALDSGLTKNEFHLFKD